MTFQDKTVLITGGTSGIGLATAILFAQRGANVVVCGRNEQRGQEAQKLISAGGGKGRYIRCDVSSASAVAGLFDELEKEYPSLDCAINCAGISNKGKLIFEFSEQEFEEIININLKGIFLCLRREIPLMLRQKRGTIVNVASVLGVRANNSKNALYTTSKHAVIGLTKEAALECAPYGVRVNAVLPGYTETNIIKDHLKDETKRRAIENLHPIRRLIQPDEVAHSIMYLCSEEAEALTGVLLPVDGGCTAM